jgi:hypothetical protein
MKVTYKITIGQTSYQSGDKTYLINLRSQSSLNIPVNTCKIVLGLPENLTIAPEDSVSVSLGNEQNSTLVFTGKVSQIDWQIDSVSIDGVSAFEKLTTAKLNLLYEKPNAGDIIKDILQKENLEISKVETGLKFPVYAVGDLIPAYYQAKILAQKCGFDFYADSEDKAVFAPYQATKTHEFKYGEDILSFNLEQFNNIIEGVEIYGESPASHGQGEQASSWLTKKEVKGSDGSSSGILLRIADPSVRSQDVAQKVAKVIWENQKKKQGGKIKVLGNSQVKLGDKIKISKMLNSQLNGNFKVTGVWHALNRRSGFITIIDWEES